MSCGDEHGSTSDGTRHGSFQIGIEESENLLTPVHFDIPWTQEQQDLGYSSRSLLHHVHASHNQRSSTENLSHLHALLQQRNYFNGLLYDSRPQSQFVPGGHFYSLHPELEQVDDDFFDLQTLRNNIYQSVNGQPPSYDIQGRCGGDGATAYTDLPLSLVDSYDSGSQTRGEEMHLGAERFINQPDIDLQQNQEAPVFCLSTQDRIYDVGFDALSSRSNSGDGIARNVHDETLRKMVYVSGDEIGAEECLPSVSSAEVNELETSVFDSMITGTYVTGTSGSAEEQVAILDLSDEHEEGIPRHVVSTSGYTTAPLTAEGLPPCEVQPGLLESFQTLAKSDENQSSQHSDLSHSTLSTSSLHQWEQPLQILSIIDENEPAQHSVRSRESVFQPLASDQIQDTPGQQLAQQLHLSTQSERQIEDQVEHEEEEDEEEEEEEAI